MSVVELCRVSRDYQMGSNTVTALKNVSFAISAGEFVAIMGASGSGKSTTMNIMGLLDSPTSGVYQLLGRDVSSLSRNELASLRNQYIGFVFQSFFLLPKLTVLENVCLPLQYRSLTTAEIARRSVQILDQVGMSTYLDHRPTELSGGQQQRVAIARALVGEPSLILADEPTGALDSVTSQQVLELLKTVHQKRDVTVVMITHDEQVAAHCQRVIRLKDGILESDNRVHELKSQAVD